MSTILHLDDSSAFLADTGDYLELHGFTVKMCTTAEEAIDFLQHSPTPDCAIVDLFLEGAAGADLSNNFIRDYLVPEHIAYIRLTSAPREVPPEFSGAGVIHKKEFYNNPEKLLATLYSLLP